MYFIRHEDKKKVKEIEKINFKEREPEYLKKKKSGRKKEIWREKKNGTREKTKTYRRSQLITNKKWKCWFSSLKKPTSISHCFFKLNL